MSAPLNLRRQRQMLRWTTALSRVVLEVGLGVGLGVGLVVGPEVRVLLSRLSLAAVQPRDEQRGPEAVTTTRRGLMTRRRGVVLWTKRGGETTKG